MKRSGKVSLHHLVPLLLRNIADVVEVEMGPGSVDDTRDTTVAISSMLHKILNGVTLRQVKVGALALAVVCHDLIEDGIGPEFAFVVREN